MIMKKHITIIVSLVICLCSCEVHNQYTIYGTISDYADGHPLSSAEVILERDHLPINSIFTGEDGNYQFIVEGCDEDSAKITVEKENYEKDSVVFILPKQSEAKTSMQNIILRRATIVYSGIVKDAFDCPIEGAEVYTTIFQKGNRLQVGSTQTDLRGEFSLSVPNQRLDTWVYYITVSKVPYSPKTSTMGHTRNDNGKNFTINFILQTE